MIQGDPVTYAEGLATLSRTPISLVVIYLDSCANVYATGDCTASAELEPCYNTYHTCKARAAFAKIIRPYEFCSTDAAVSWPGPRPYVKQITYLPTEITDNITVSGRIKVQFSDEPDGDIGIDPYVTQRAAWPNIPGTYFKKLAARNPNYKGRMLEIYEGFAGLPREEYRLRANEPLELISFDRGSVTVETVDLLRGLGDIQTPAKLDIKLLGDLDDMALELIVADTPDVVKLPDAGYVRIDSEIIQYGGINRDQRKLETCTRGVMASVAATHSAKTTVQICRYYPPANPFDHLQEILLTDAAYAPELVDSAAFDYWRDWPGGEVVMTAFFSEPQKLSEIYAGLVNLLDCKCWVAENLRITIARNIPNAPGRTYRELSDEASIIDKSAKVNMNESSRKTRAILHWDKSVLGKADEQSSYGRRDIGIEATAEKEYNDVVEEEIFTPWIHINIMQEEVLADYLVVLLARRVFARRDACPLITLAVELKDSDIKTGEFATLVTDELLNVDGTPVTTRFQIVRRDFQGQKVELKTLRIPVKRAAFYAPEEAVDYATATPEQREYGGFYSDDLGKMPNGDEGFYYY